MTKKRVLVIDDSVNDAQLLLNILHEHSEQFECTHLLGLDEALGYLSTNEVDIAVLELNLQNSFGLQSFNRLSEAQPKLPIVIFSSLADEELALNAVRAGAQDYVYKTGLNDRILLRSIQFAIERKQKYEFARSTMAQLQETMAALNLSAKASNTGLWFLDLETERVTWNDQTTALFGLPPGKKPETLNEVYALVHRDDVERVAETVRKSAGRSDVWETDYLVVWEDNSRHHLHCEGKTFFDETGRATRMAGTCRDVTRQREQEETNRRLALLEQREDFTATLTHDLKNPLIGTNQILEVMLSHKVGPVTPQQANLLGQIKNSNTHLLNLIQNLTDVYRFEHQVSTYERQKTDVIPIIMSCISEMAIMAETRNISMNMEACDNEWLMIVDSLAFRRVIQNLLDNAVKFTAENGAVKCRLLKEDDATIIEIMDTGVGISPRDQSNLFKRFTQGEINEHSGVSSRTTGGSGTGLGLYLCKQIVDAHNGMITCESEPGVGTTFRLRFPSASQTAHTEVNETN